MPEAGNRNAKTLKDKPPNNKELEILKIDDVFKRLFPSGTYDTENGDRGWAKPPLNPIDAFAFVAHLLVQSGAYHHVVTAITEPSASETYPVRRIAITKKDVGETERFGGHWREQPESLTAHDQIVVPPRIGQWWNDIYKCHKDAVFKILPSNAPAPTWWKPAVLILMAADHACKGVGYPVKLADASDETSKSDWLQAIVEKIRYDAEAADKPPAAITLSSAPPDVLCVTPKSHTSQIGCAIGSLSHNLALLPPHGVVRARWHFGRVDDPMKADTEPFRMLLIPFPYAVKASCFRPARETELGEKWGWFEVDQRWLPKRTCPRGSAPGDPNLLMTNADLSTLSDADEELTTFVEDLINKAQAEVGGVDALVFPELSLDPVSLGAMQRLAYRKDVAFVLAGVSHGPRRAGNFVAVTRVFAAPPGLNEDDPKLSQALMAATAFRSKHHRWRLDEQQIVRYRLGGTLRPDFLWWEKLDITSRTIDVFNFRRNSNMTALICEDLARIEPCQQAVRAIGPNIVVALLMDGPQTPERWPARYATVLADDPGCAVLSFTSLGLIDRSQSHDRPNLPRSIGLWKDGTGVSRTIVIPSGHHAAVVTLNAWSKREYTLDGREDKTAYSWRLTAVETLRSDHAVAWITNGAASDWNVDA